MEKKNVTIRAFKYGNRPHYEWSTTLLELTNDYSIVKGEPGRELHHFTKNEKFIMDNFSIEFFPFDKWYNVIVDIKDGRVEGHYCNIAKPAKMEGDIISFIDLDLDLIERDGVWRLVDEEDFAENQVKYNYPPSLVEETKLKLEELKNCIVKGKVPFDDLIQQYVSKVLEESLKGLS